MRKFEDVPCPVCHAEVGQPCVSTPGYRAAVPSHVRTSWPTTTHHRGRIMASDARAAEEEG